MPTVRDLCRRALITAQAQDPIQDTPANLISDAMEQFQTMAEYWDTMALWPYSSTTINATLVAGQSIYTFGTGGDIDSPRPNSVQTAQVNSGGVLYGLTELSYDDYFANTRLADLQGIPRSYGYRHDYPLGSLFVWPAPDQAYPIVMQVPILIGALTLDTELSLPPGYFGAFEYGLAVILADRLGNDISPAIRQEAMDRKNRLKLYNSMPRAISAEYVGRMGPTNILTNR